ncbi:polysaccharide lyase 8 family protein [Companilactobacillus nantensis]|nr:polysaccharide lyase 8 family protein [Companilactobacillus nantensis]GEO63392.1 hypothetical protein LNA01_05750 [Companilactobacillus nantensis]
MKKRYMIFISATLSVLALQVNNVDAATTDNGDNSKAENVQDNFETKSKISDDSKTTTDQTTTSDINNALKNDRPTTTYNALVQNKSVPQKESITTTTPQSKSVAVVTAAQDTPKTDTSNKDDYDKMLQSWKDVVVGDSYYDNSNQEMTQMGSQKDKKVTQLWNSMDKSDQRKNLWNGIEELTTSAHITTDYRNLESLAIATVNPGSKYYNDPQMVKDVVDGFNWLNVNKYNQNIKAYGNWWDWEIGTPLFVNNIATVMQPYLTKEQVKNSMDAITFFVPDPDYFRGSVYPQYKAEATGANQVDIAKVKIIQALIEKDESGLKKAIKALEKVFPLVNDGEGFYRDGSFIQHENVGYNASYGNVLVDGVSQLLPVIQGTPYALSDDSMNSIKFWVEKGFSPFVYKGNSMDMVRGRAISRAYFQSNDSGADLIRSITRVISTYPASEKAKFQSLIKYWLSYGNNYENYIQQLTSYRDVDLISKIMNDDTIEAADFQNTNLYNFATMDKVLLKNGSKNFAIGINMSSSRIKRYESLNNENLHGWYTGDGMLFVYNNDLNQYNDNYWATVDPYRLPGTTETDAVQKNAAGAKPSTKSFVGGSVFGNIGSIGNVGSIAMDFINNDGNLTAHKSWFLMNDGVVALGSAINNTSKNKALTVIDNRKLADTSKYTIYVNGAVYEPKLNNPQQLENVSSIYLQSDKPDESIGYKFITPQNLNLGLIERQGAWSEINTAESKTEYIRKYLEIYKNHVQADDTYNYVIYPNVSLDEFNNITVPKIIKNTNDAQIVKYGATTGINIFKAGDEKVDGMEFTNPISVTKIDNGNQKLFGISDPSQNIGAETTFKIKDNGYRLMNSDKNLQVKLVDGYWNVSLLTNGHNGETHFLSLAK